VADPCSWLNRKNNTPHSIKSLSPTSFNTLRPSRRNKNLRKCESCRRSRKQRVHIINVKYHQGHVSELQCIFPEDNPDQPCEWCQDHNLTCGPKRTIEESRSEANESLANLDGDKRSAYEFIKDMKNKGHSLDSIRRFVHCVYEVLDDMAFTRSSSIQAPERCPNPPIPPEILLPPQPNSSCDSSTDAHSNRVETSSFDRSFSSVGPILHFLPTESDRNVMAYLQSFPIGCITPSPLCSIPITEQGPSIPTEAISYAEPPEMASESRLPVRCLTCGSEGSLFCSALCETLFEL